MIYSTEMNINSDDEISISSLVSDQDDPDASALLDTWDPVGGHRDVFSLPLFAPEPIINLHNNSPLFDDFSDANLSNQQIFESEEEDQEVADPEIENIIEERYQFCTWLYLIKKDTDKKNKKKREQGEKNLVYMGIFVKPCHIKKLFGNFFRTPQYTHITTLEGHTDDVLCLTLSKNKLYSGSWGDTIRVWKV